MHDGHLHDIHFALSWISILHNVHVFKDIFIQQRWQILSSDWSEGARDAAVEK